MSEHMIERNPDILELMSSPVLSANQLRELHPLREGHFEALTQHRIEIADIMSGRDDRILFIGGPCSTDDARLENGEFAAVAYSKAMHQIFEDPELKRIFKYVERCNPAKPRTDIGPRGLEESNLELVHRILTEIVNTGNPLTFEIMNDKQLARYGDMLSMAWVGARDVHSTDLRHAISAYPEIPFFFKNDTYGNMDIARNARETVRHPRLVEVHDGDNQLVHVDAPGHNTTGLIFRGGGSVTSPETFNANVSLLVTQEPLVIDCSHANGAAFDQKGEKSAAGQLACLQSVAELVSQGKRPIGVMVESYLLEGKGDQPGQSKTDPCLSLEQTIEAIETLARAITTSKGGM